MPAFTHDGLQEDLAAHLRGNTSRMVWTNTQLGPAGSPRPDVFTVDKSYSRFRADCYEIKVSVSDLRHDITSGKWQSYRKFGHAVWFAFERGLAPLDLIPRDCGVILRGDGGWRAARKPVAQVLDTLPRDAWLKLLIESCPEGHEIELGRRLRTANTWHVEQVARKKLGDELGAMLADTKQAESILNYRKQAAEAELASLEKWQKEQRENLRAREAEYRQVLDAELVDIGVMLGLKREEVTASKLSHALSSFRSSLRGHALRRAINELTVLAGELDQMTGSNVIHPC